jgi:hypothetical protein
MLNKREFNRIKFNEPIIATIELITKSFNDVFNSTDVIEIYVVDLSAGGLKFAHKVEFMVNFLTIYKINLQLNGKNLVFYGKIIRKRKFLNLFYEYGFKFDFSNSKNLSLYST